MKKIDLYEIAIKILGLYLVVIIISDIRVVVFYLTSWTQQKNNPDMFGDFDDTPALLATVLGFLALITLSSFLIFRTRQIATLISQKTDIEEDLKLFADRKTIYEICLVLLGLITVVLTLPDFIIKLKNHIRLVQSNVPTPDYNWTYYDTTFLITSGIKIGIGIIAIIYSDQLSNWLTKKR
jgi:hypothetical protein